jgi:hypothetical protein
VERERVRRLAVIAAVDALDPRRAPRRAVRLVGQPMRDARGHVPPARADRADRTRGDAGPLDAGRARIEAVGRPRRDDVGGHEDRRAERDPRSVDRMDQHADEARTAEARELAEQPEVDARIRRPADARAGDVARGLRDRVAHERVQWIVAGRRGHRSAKRAPQRGSAVADDDDAAGLRRARRESLTGGHARVVCGHARCADEIESDVRETRTECGDNVRHGLDNAYCPSLPKPVSPHHHPIEEEFDDP